MDQPSAKTFPATAAAGKIESTVFRRAEKNCQLGFGDPGFSGELRKLGWCLHGLWNY